MASKKTTTSKKSTASKTKAVEHKAINDLKTLD